MKEKIIQRLKDEIKERKENESKKNRKKIKK